MLTGASGFIGSHIAERLLAKPVETHLFARKMTPRLARFAARGAVMHVGRPCDLELLHRSMVGADTVIHCAGATRGLRERDYFQVNVGFTDRLLGLLKERQRFIFISSQAVLGPSSPNHLLDEHARPAPLTFYGKSKLSAEKQIQKWGAANSNRFVILRPCTVYGPREKDLFSYFKLLEMGIFPRIRKGKNRLSLVYVGDLVAAVLQVAASPICGQTFNVAGNGIFCWNQIADCICKALGRRRVIKIDIPCKWLPRVAAISDMLSQFTRRPALLNRQKAIEAKQAAWLCSSQKLQRTLPWRPCFSLQDGIRFTVSWYKKNGWL